MKNKKNRDWAQVIGIDKEKTICLQKEDWKKFKIGGTKPLHLD